MRSKFYKNNAGSDVIELQSRDGDGVAIIRDMTIAEPFATGKTIPVNSSMRNGYKWYWFNWHSLTDAEKIEAGAMVWMFDEEAQKWHPLTRPYTGG